MLEVRLLGKFAVNLAGRPIEIPWHPAQLLLAYLILNVGTAQRREKLAGLLWPDSDELNARNNLRQTLWRLRQALGEDYILADKILVGFNPEADYQLDVDCLLDGSAETGSVDELIRIVSTYEGSLLPGFYEDWIVLEQERLQAVFEHKMQVLLNRLVEAQRWPDVLAWGERWIALGQTPEPAYRALMLAYGGLGDRSSVVAVYQRCVKALKQELGVEPSEQTRKLYERLLSAEEPAPEPAPARAGLSGQAIGPYRLVEIIGAGGMAEVYKAYQPRLDRYVAVKFIKPELVTSGNFRVRFEREAKIMAQLNHPNIVHVYDFGEAGRHYYLVMEYVTGGTLKDWLKKTHQVGQVIDPDQVVPILRQLSAALDFAHQQGIIHRDIKPSNIMLTPDGRALLADFGLAKLIDSSGDLTKTSLTTGTPAYMSPEQVEGDPAKIGPASDLYSLGIVLYELVTGQLPFTANSSVALMFKHVNEAVPSPRSLNPDLTEALEQVLLKALAKEPAERYQRAGELTEAFAATLLSGTMPTPSSPVSSNPPLVKLPLQPTPFIGREEELSRLTTLLADPTVKLVTLVGPGGIGKTRLAIEAARAQAEAFADGFYFVSLASLDSPVMISSQIANALNFGFYVRDQHEHGKDDLQIEQLLAYLQEKQLLLVLDNAEHLLTTALPSLPKREKSVDELVATIVRVAPNVKILATSRERLNLHGETLLPLAGLSVPERETNKTQGVPSLENVLDFAAYGAIELFRQSARRVQPGFELRPDNLIDVINICYLVEGLPLGIELAAAWVELLSPAEIATEIRNSLDFLETNLRDIPDRQRSIRLVFETSWQRLTQTEQEVFQQLSIFRGGFSREAVQIVTRASLRTLMALVNKSLLRPDFKGRYQMHELLRQFAGEKLAQRADEATAIRERHSNYYLGFLKAREKLLTGKEQPKALDEISMEIDNIQTGWRWAVEQGHLEAIDQAVEALYNFYEIRSRFQEGEEIFAQAISQLQQAEVLNEHPSFEVVLHRLAARRGAFFYFLDNYEAAHKHLLESLNSAGQPSELVFALTRLGGVAVVQGKQSVADELFRQSLMICREIGDLYGAAKALQGLAYVKAQFGDHAATVELARECLALSRQLGRPDLVASALDMLAWPTNCLGAYRESEAYCQESRAIYEKIGNQWGVAISLNNLGWVAWCIGGSGSSEAIAHYQKALTIFRQIGDRQDISMSCGDLALATSELGNYELAIQYGREGLAVAKEMGDIHFIMYNLYGLGAATCGLGDLQASKNYLTEALQLAWETQTLDNTMNILFYFATLLVKESQGAASPEQFDPQKKTKALELLAMVIGHPATWQPIKDRAARLQAELEMELPPEVIAAARARGKSRKLEDVVVEMLRETV